MTGFVYASDGSDLKSDGNLSVCISGTCDVADKVVTKHFLSDALAVWFQSNLNQKISLCDADIKTKACSDKEIISDVQVGVTNVSVKIPFASLIDAKLTSDKLNQNFVWDYEMSVGETYPLCQASLNQLKITDLNNIQITMDGFSCDFTNKGSTSVKTDYQIDYIDFDNGFIGANYEISFSGASFGQKTGYALLRLEKPFDVNDAVMKACECSCSDNQMPLCRCVNDEALTKKAEPEVIVVDKTETPPSVETEQKLEQVISNEAENTEIQKASVEDIPPVVEQAKIVETDVVATIPLVEEVTLITETQILKPGVPVVMDVEEDVMPGQVRAVSNWE
jgi:hypothetical protein